MAPLVGIVSVFQVNSTAWPPPALLCLRTLSLSSHVADVHLFANRPLPFVISNVFHHQLEADGYAMLVLNRTNVMISPFASFYKLKNELKPLYGLLFEAWLTPYKWWGYMDLDIVVGELNLIPLDSQEYDLITFDRNKISGQLSLFRNVPEMNQLFKACSQWKAVVASPYYHNFDEEGSEKVRYTQFDGAKPMAACYRANWAAGNPPWPCTVGMTTIVMRARVRTLFAQHLYLGYPTFMPTCLGCRMTFRDGVLADAAGRRGVLCHKCRLVNDAGRWRSDRTVVAVANTYSGGPLELKTSSPPRRQNFAVATLFDHERLRSYEAIERFVHSWIAHASTFNLLLLVHDSQIEWCLKSLVRPLPKLKSQIIMLKHNTTPAWSARLRLWSHLEYSRIAYFDASTPLEADAATVFAACNDSAICTTDVSRFSPMVLETNGQRWFREHLAEELRAIPLLNGRSDERRYWSSALPMGFRRIMSLGTTMSSV